MMNIIRVLALVVTSLLFMTWGIISVYKPHIAGMEFYWVKYKHFYIPKYKNSTNKYFHKQIRTVGLGLILSSVIMFIFTIVYVIYPDILTFMSYK